MIKYTSGGGGGEGGGEWDLHILRGGMWDSFKIDCGMRDEKQKIAGHGCYTENCESNQAGCGIIISRGAG